MYFDAHNHFHDEWLAPSHDELLALLPNLSIAGMVVNGTCPADWPDVLRLADRGDWIFPALGLHPWQVGNRPADWLDTLTKFLEANPHASIGEIGLDRWMLDRARPDDPRLTGLKRATLSEQKQVFNQQLDLACELSRPATIHCIDAWGALLESLSERAALPQQGFLLHAYSGPAEMVQPFARLGARFSFNGSYLDPRRHNIRLAFLEVPRDRLLVETDAPAMLPPDKWRLSSKFKTPDGAPLNTPANIAAIYQGLAECLGLPLEDLCRQVADNFHALFEHDSPHLLDDKAML